MSDWTKAERKYLQGQWDNDHNEVLELRTYCPNPECVPHSTPDAVSVTISAFTPGPREAEMVTPGADEADMVAQEGGPPGRGAEIDRRQPPPADEFPFPPDAWVVCHCKDPSHGSGGGCGREGTVPTRREGP